jgi:hypothetical protein
MSKTPTLFSMIQVLLPFPPDTDIVTPTPPVTTHFVHREVEAADKARELYRKLGRP